MYFGRVSFENTSQLYETFDNINFQTIVIASNSTEPDDYWMKVRRISSTMIQYWKYFREASARDCHRARQIKETIAWEILQVMANLQVCLRVRRNRLLQVYDTSWKFRFREYIRFDLDSCSEKKVFVFGFDFALNGYENFYTCASKWKFVCWNRKAPIYNQKQILDVIYKKDIKHNICSPDLAEGRVT